ncbi:uncharacterized protein [Dermacentor albipictus]|uniref:uncharacterized protein n=1 Tax=Dermacentor albipictus TaxID=60249 RepID=UPI0038FC1AAE
MCSVLCTGRKLLAHSRNCKLGAHHTHQYPHPLLELQGHTRNHMCLVVYAGLLRHMLKLPASQSCNLLIHRTGRYPDIRLELQGHTQIHKCLQDMIMSQAHRNGGLENNLDHLGFFSMHPVHGT